MVFVKPTDPYVADLLFTLAHLNAHLADVESAEEVLKLAETYGYANTVRVGTLRTKIDAALRKAKWRGVAFWSLGVGAVLGALVYAHRRKWFFLTRRAYIAHHASLRLAGRRDDVTNSAVGDAKRSEAAIAVPPGS